MPTSTFFNLPREKRDKLLAAIKEELSRVPFEEVSINKIVRSAGIARGSFYQYFHDKPDMLGYILSGFQEQLMGHIRDSLERSGGDVFRLFTDILDFSILFSQGDDALGLHRQLFTDRRIHAMLFQARDRIRTEMDLLPELRSRISTENLSLQSEEDFLDMVETLMAVTRDASFQIVSSTQSHGEVRRRYLNKLALLKRGYAKA